MDNNPLKELPEPLQMSYDNAKGKGKKGKGEEKGKSFDGFEKGKGEKGFEAFEKGFEKGDGPLGLRS